MMDIILILLIVGFFFSGVGGWVLAIFALIYVIGIIFFSR